MNKKTLIKILPILAFSILSFFIGFISGVLFDYSISIAPNDTKSNVSSTESAISESEEISDETETKTIESHESEQSEKDIMDGSSIVDDPIKVNNSESDNSSLTEVESINSSESSNGDESSIIVDNEKLLSYLQSADLSIDDLTQKNCKQLITVNSSGNTASINYFYLNENNIWQEQYDLATDGYVGSNGVSKYSHEGSYETPFGLYPIEDAFYIDIIPDTSLNLFQITDDTYWVDDPDSVYYNKRVEGTENMDWNSAEHMIDYYSSYHYGFVIGFNTTDTIPGKGSAFFFHVSYQPTAGCVGVSEYMVLKYLSQLDSNLNPYILMQ